MRLQDVELLRNTKFATADHINLLDQTASKIQELLVEHNLLEKGWDYRFSKTKRFCGRCWYQYKVIEISIYHVFTPNANVLDTIKHEIAHALVGPFVKSHGREWKYAAASIGAWPKACTTNKAIAVEPHYLAICPTCGAKFKRHRKLKQFYICWCKKCGREKGLLTYHKVD